MAELKSGELGSPVGKIGNLVFRQMNGKTFVSNRPEKYNRSNSEKAKLSRSGFSTVVKFSKLICSYPVLKSCWKKARIEGTSPYHRIIKYNLPEIHLGLLTIKNRITPRGFNLSVFEITKENGMLTFNLGINELISDLNNPNLYFYAVNFLCNPVENKINPYELISFQKNIFTTDKTGLTTFIVDISGKDSLPFAKYLNGIIFLAVVAEVSGRIMRWTSTFARQF